MGSSPHNCVFEYNLSNSFSAKTIMHARVFTMVYLSGRSALHTLQIRTGCRYSRRVSSHLCGYVYITPRVHIMYGID